MHSLKSKLLLFGSVMLASIASAAEADSTQRVSITPIGALWRSLVVPGWGQLYYGSVPKAALFFGASATIAGIVVWNNTRYLDADRRYWQYDSTDGRKTLALREREFYRDQRDVAALWLVAVYAFNAMDAYVGGHMASFTLGDRTELRVIPFGDRIALVVKW